MNAIDIITAMATSATAIVAIIMMLDNWKPILMHPKKICNPGKSPLYFTKIYTRTGTFPIIARDAEMRGHFSDSRLQELSLNKLLYYGEEFSDFPQFLYVDGQKCQFDIKIRHDFSRGISFHNYKIEALPCMP